jgi:hypothetical protein
MVERTGKLKAREKRLVSQVNEITAAFITSGFILNCDMTRLGKCHSNIIFGHTLKAGIFILGALKFRAIRSIFSSAVFPKL